MWQTIHERSKIFDEEVVQMQYRVAMGERPKCLSVAELGAMHSNITHMDVFGSGSGAISMSGSGNNDSRSSAILSSASSSSMLSSPPTSMKSSSSSSYRRIRVDEDEVAFVDADLIERYLRLMRQCWAQDPRERPSFVQIHEELSTLTTRSAAASSSI
eukprot:GEZU01024396.1.p1 GENE.GEZU01024396.1~~GEZU01024396.1.p1  ORF type:complete len:158 (+),score=36.16 GEZU01024396.1:88-561(+)